MCRWVCLRLGGHSAPHPALIAPQGPLGLEHVHSVGCDPRKALLHGFFLLLLHFWLLCCFPCIKVTSLLVSSETSIAVGSVPRRGVLHSAPGEVSPLSTALSSVLRPAFPSPSTRLHPQAQPLHH